MHDPKCDCEPDEKTGRRVCGRRVQVRGGHEPLIDEATWNAYRREREKRMKVKSPKARHARWHLGGGLTVCERCGGNLVVNSYTSPKSQAICSTYKLSGRPCEGVWINRVHLELIVDDWLEHHLAEWADAQDQLTGVDDERVLLSRELSLVKGEEDRIATGLREALKLVQRGLATQEDYEESKREVDAERTKLTDRIADLQAQLDALDPDADTLDRLERNEITDPMELNAVMKRLLRRIVVSPDEVIVEPWRGTTWIYDRPPRRPKRERETAHGADGRFTAAMKART
jgi:hypothetical protein